MKFFNKVLMLGLIFSAQLNAQNLPVGSKMDAFITELTNKMKLYHP